MVVHVDEDGLNIESTRTEVNAALHEWKAQQHLAKATHTHE